jgi:ACS family pantothenate transporter-like MFS transporter
MELLRTIENPLTSNSYVACFFSFTAAAMQAYSIQGLLLLTLKAHQKSHHYTQTQINTYPLGIHGIAIISEFVVAILIDRFGLRLTTGLSLCAIQCVVSAVLLIPDLPVSGNLTAYYLAATAYGINPLLYGWPSQIAAKTGDDAVRSVVLAGMVAMGMLLYTFWGIAIYPADEAPFWRNGYIAMICVSAVLAGWLFVMRWVSD